MTIQICMGIGRADLAIVLNAMEHVSIVLVIVTGGENGV